MNTHKQVAGFLLSPDWIADPALSKPYIQEMKDHGYRTIILFIRHMTLDVRSPQVHDAIKWMVDTSHRLDLKFVLDTEYLWWGMRFTEENPDSRQVLTKAYEAIAYDGEFEFDIAWPSVPNGGITVFRDITAIFRDQKRISDDLIEYDWQNQAMPQRGANIRGRFKDGYDGPFTAYASIDAFTLVESASKEYQQAQMDLLNQYADIPLDGICWDEPGKGSGDPSYIRATPSFLERFQERNGYDLRDKLLHLTKLEHQAETIRVRHDYYQTLSDLNYETQKNHYDLAKKLYGDDIMLGSHHTWAGMVADLSAGVLDYFRLGNLLTASWTDGSWWCELRYQAFYYLLADGIRLELGLRDAYYNDWTKQIPAVEEMRFANRYKKLFRTNWFNIFFSRFTECEVNFRHEPLRSKAIEDVRDLDVFDDFLGDGFMPDSSVALLYQWESVAVAPPWISRAYYSSITNLSQYLVDSGHFATMVSPNSFAKAKIGNGFIEVDGRRHAVIVAPFLYAPSRDLWRQLKAFSQAGVNVILNGPLPEFTLEGDQILEEAAELIGVKPFSFKKYESGFTRRHPLPSPTQWEPEWFDFTYPASVTTGESEKDSENRIHYVKSSTSSLYYMPAIDPREDLISLISKLASRSPYEYVGENAYTRVFRDPDKPEEQVLLFVAHGRRPDTPLVPDRYDAKARPPRQDLRLKIWARLPQGALEINGGTWQAVKIVDGNAVETIGDCPNVLFNGNSILSSI